MTNLIACTGLPSHIASYSLDDPSAELPFSRRLARDNRWSADYTARVVEEYKRFAWLASRSHEPLTPSDEVDQAWHLHLTYTRDYWQEFCPSVLGKPLHHGPTRGGSRELHKHEDWYARTLARYREAFGCEPPSDIWPSSRERFARGASGVRVYRDDYWFVPRPRAWLRSLRLISPVRALPLAASSLCACETSSLLGVAALGFVLFVMLMPKKEGTDGRDGCGGGGCGGGGCGSGCGGCGGCGGC